MDRGVHIQVVIPEKNDASDLEIRWDEGSNVIECYLDGNIIFSGDWDGNFKQLFEQLLKEVH